MPRLEIDFNCMCLFVPDPKAGSGKGLVHVLMPSTSDADGCEHVVRMDYVGKDGKSVQRRFEGWAVTLGGASPSVKLPLTAPKDGSNCHIVSLTPLTRDATHPNG